MQNLYFYCMSVLLYCKWIYICIYWYFWYMYAVWVEYKNISAVFLYTWNEQDRILPRDLLRNKKSFVTIEEKDLYSPCESLWWSYPQQCLCSSSHPLRLSQPLLSSSLHVGIPPVTTEADAAEKPGSDSASNALNCVSACTESCRETEQSRGCESNLLAKSRFTSKANGYVVLRPFYFLLPSFKHLSFSHVWYFPSQIWALDPSPSQL